MSGASGDTGPSRWDDLALNQPGQAVRDRADALYLQWRERSWWGRRTTRRTEEQDSRRLAEGQVYLAKQLARLGDSWRVLHQIPAGPDHAGIDHLVIGPGGVFTVNSRHHAKSCVRLGGDTLMVDGQRVHHVRDSRLEAEAAAAALSLAVGFDVPVVGLVVIVGDNRFDVSNQPADALVQVTTPRAGLRLLRNCGVEWTSYGVDRIYAAARRSTTWDGVAVDQADEATVETAPKGEKAPTTRRVPVADVSRAAS